MEAAAVNSVLTLPDLPGETRSTRLLFLPAREAWVLGPAPDTVCVFYINQQ